MRTLSVTPAAEQDLRDIWSYIAAFDVAAADRVARRLDVGIRRVHEMPNVGHRRGDVSTPGLWFSVVRPYVIGYEFDERSVTIVRVVHGSRDFRPLFP